MSKFSTFLLWFAVSSCVVFHFRVSILEKEFKSLKQEIETIKKHID